jgi:pimeloyl-ACP methyl ester carboxylesterase
LRLHALLSLIIEDYFLWHHSPSIAHQLLPSPGGLFSRHAFHISCIPARLTSLHSANEPSLSLKIHGFTGSSRVWQRNIPAFAQHYRVIAPDLRGHGESDKCKHGYHVARLAMDLRELVTYLDHGEGKEWKAIGGSLGCAILW